MSYRDLNRLAAVEDQGFGAVGDQGFGSSGDQGFGSSGGSRLWGRPEKQTNCTRTWKEH